MYVSDLICRWQSNEKELRESGRQVIEAVKEASGRTHETVTEDKVKLRLDAAVTGAFRHFAQSYDKQYGGFGKAPKFPSPPSLSFLLRLASPDCDFKGKNGTSAVAKEMALGTLEHMAIGGIHDHISGGFHRYSVDPHWHLPHFEKMLYDQGQLMSVYASAYAIKQDPVFKGAIFGIYEYVMGSLRDQSGAFYCAEDADSVPGGNEQSDCGHGSSAKKEGAFALWSWAELEEILPERLRETFMHHYGVQSGGNISPAKDPHGEMTGLNVLDALLNFDKSAKSHPGKSQLEFEEGLAEGKKLVEQRRALRPKPHRDEKILAAWNGLMISGLCRAYRTMGLAERYLTAAESAARFILDKMIDADGYLMRVYKEPSQNQIRGFPDDYANTIQSLLDLYEATLKAEYLDVAGKLQSRMNAQYWQEDPGAFCSTSGTEGLPVRLVDDYDGAEPSSNSVAAMNLARLALLTENMEYDQQMKKLFASFSGWARDLPHSMPALLDAYLYSSTPPLLAVIEAPSREAAEELHLTALSTYHACMAIKGVFSDNFGIAKAHVCWGRECSAPTSEDAQFAALLRR